MRLSPGPNGGSPKRRRPSPAPGPIAHAGVAGARERCAAMEREVATLLRCRARARTTRWLEAIGRDLERLGSDAMAAARRRLERADDGTALIGGRADRGRGAARRSRGRRRPTHRGGVARRQLAVSPTPASTSLASREWSSHSASPTTLEAWLRRGDDAGRHPRAHACRGARGEQPHPAPSPTGAVSARVGDPLRTTTNGYQP